MIFIVLFFIFGLICGFLINNKLNKDGEFFDVEGSFRNLKNMFLDYFFASEIESDVVCPTCEALMKPDKKMVSIDSDEVLGFIYICPYCSTQQYVYD